MSKICGGLTNIIFVNRWIVEHDYDGKNGDNFLREVWNAGRLKFHYMDSNQNRKE